MTVLDASAVLAELDVTGLRELLSAAGVTVEPLSATDAELAGAMRSLRGGQSPLIGRPLLPCPHCPKHPAEVLTADRGWADLGLPLRVRLIH